MKSSMDDSRRGFFLAAVGTGLVIAGCSKSSAPDDVAPPEDLMREHGALNRILLMYEESARRLEAKEATPIEVVAKSADIIRHFIEEYHEKLEEDFLFPRFEKANKLVELVATLRRQHKAGRVLTEDIQRLARDASVAKDDDRNHLVSSIKSFIRMYRPHEAREDTVLFPAFRTIVTAKEFHDLGEQFEDKEHELFGKDGFEGVVAQVATLEDTLGVADLNQFTPNT